MSHLIIHMGLHKTGTSSLQQFCARNRQELEKHKIIYPAFHDQGHPHGVVVHHGLTLNIAHYFSEFALSCGAQSAWDILIDKYANTDKTVLISSEEFTRGRRGFRVDMQKLRKIADAFDQVTIICVLREQIGFLQSIFYENSRFGRPISTDWLINNAITRNDATGLWADFRPMWKHLVSGFDAKDIVLLDYDTLKNSSMGVIGSILKFAGVTAQQGAKNASENGSPAPGPYLLCQQICSPKPVPPELLQAVSDQFTKTFGATQRGSVFTRKQAEKIRTYFSEPNAHLTQMVKEHHPNFAFSIPDAETDMVYQDDIPEELRKFALSQVHKFPQLTHPKALTSRVGLEPDSEKIGLIAAVKNEGPWVLEWVAHHLAIGFDVIAVASNDCSDLTHVILGRLAELGHIIHIDQTGATGMSPQMNAYQKLRNHAAMRDCAWLMTLDGDQLFNPRASSVQEFVGAFPNSDIIATSWRVFGDSGLSGFPTGNLTGLYTKAAGQTHRANALFKSIFRNPRRFEAINYHIPSRSIKPSELVITIDGKDLYKGIDDQHENLRRFLEHERKQQKIQPNFRFGQINHYATKTKEIFAFKRTRGRGVHHKSIRHTDQFFNQFNRNEHDDLSISIHTARTQMVLDQFLSDSTLFELHRKTCDLWEHHIKQGRNVFE